MTKTDRLFRLIAERPDYGCTRLAREVGCSEGHAHAVKQHVRALASGDRRCSACSRVKPATSFNAGYSRCRSCFRHQRRGYRTQFRSDDGGATYSVYRLAWGNGAYYIGRSRNPWRRFEQHRWSHNPLVRSMYAVEVPSMTILDEGLGKAEACALESSEIYDGDGHLYPLCLNLMQCPDGGARLAKVAAMLDFGERHQRGKRKAASV